MTSSRVGHSLTGGGHVLQDMKEAMSHEGGVSNARVLSKQAHVA